jgi:hypothetical protein
VLQFETKTSKHWQKTYYVGSYFVDVIIEVRKSDIKFTSRLLRVECFISLLVCVREIKTVQQKCHAVMYSITKTHLLLCIDVVVCITK